MSADQVIEEARKWLGVPWKHQGRSASGIDCAGLVIKVGHAAGAFSFDTNDYRAQARDESMIGLCNQHLVPSPGVEPGAVAVMRFAKNRHMGIFGRYGDEITLIHAYAMAPRKVVEHRFSFDWLRSEGASLLAVFRFP